MRTEITQMVIYYPNGSTQVVKPNMLAFKGGWQQLAEAIAEPHYPRGVKIKYELR